MQRRRSVHTRPGYRRRHPVEKRDDAPRLDRVAAAARPEREERPNVVALDPLTVEVTHDLVLMDRADGRGTAYWALGEVLKEHLCLLESDPPEVALDRLGGREILGLTLGLDVARDLHPLAVRDRFQDAWAEFLTDVVADRPTVVLVEDIHWAEPQLLDLLEYVLGSVEGRCLWSLRRDLNFSNAGRDGAHAPPVSCSSSTPSRRRTPTGCSTRCSPAGCPPS